MDRAKEALFNILANRLDFSSIRVADLFSGTGAIAFEFLSRGALHATCVERNARHVAQIRANAQALGLTNINVVRADVVKYLRTPESFDVVFADPPYAYAGLAALPGFIMSSGALRAGGLLVVEHGEELQPAWEGVREERRYGDAVFAFFGGEQ